MGETTIVIMDYSNKQIAIDIDMSNVARIIMQVVTGDERLFVIYKDYSTETFDSSFSRTADYPDDEYDLFYELKGINLLEDEKWLKRTDSCSYTWDLYVGN